jgi:uncharacterized protein (DUF952 family)
VDPADLLADALCHLATEGEWAAYEGAGVITPASLDTEGFVHCSWGRQVPGTIQRHYPSATDLVALLLDEAALPPGSLVAEDTAGVGEPFPHVYAPIPLAAVRSVHRLDPPDT